MFIGPLGPKKRENRLCVLHDEVNDVIHKCSLFYFIFLLEIKRADDKLRRWPNFGHIMRKIGSEGTS